MPHNIIWEETGTVWQFSGSVDSDEIFKAGLEYRQDPRSEGKRYRICDFLTIDDIEVTSDEALLIASLDESYAQKNPNVKVAVVAKLRMMKRMANFYVIGLQRSSWDARLFDNLEEARNWISE